MDEKGEEVASVNPDANGNAWFVSKIQTVNSADEEMKALDKLDTKNVAVRQFRDFEVSSPPKFSFSKDSLSTIKLDLYKPNHLIYTSNNSNEGFAVFSEIYYKHGWKATIDGAATPIYKVDYTLRGIEIPKGKHTIEFKFEPQVIKTGSTIALFSSIGMILVIIGGVYFDKRKNEKSQS
jgi:LPXTG-motif cell wall-anchored protein